MIKQPITGLKSELFSNKKHMIKEPTLFQICQFLYLTLKNVKI